MTAFSNSIYCVLGPIIDGSICSGWTKDKLYRGNSALSVAAVAFWHRIMVDEDPPLRVAGGAGARSVCVVWRLRGRGGRGSLVLVHGGCLFALCAFLLWMAEPSHARSGGVVTVCALGSAVTRRVAALFAGPRSSVSFLPDCLVSCTLCG
ncbi:hypothetical protein TcYC6_0094270 [Trypanosoma cruzi]|nr:hypothetical protein TcYC6_0094270 [Trypanosoma cruzi]